MPYRVGDTVTATIRVHVASGEISEVRANYVLRGEYPSAGLSLPRATSIPMTLASREGENLTFSGTVPRAIFGGTYAVSTAYTFYNALGRNDAGFGILNGHDIEIVDDPTDPIPPAPVVTIA
jgi:hypothetical protein